MMDNSDGLGLSLPDLAALSRVGFLVYEEKLPLAEGLAEMVGRERAVDILRIHELWTSILAFICKARDMITARLMWTPDIAAPMTHKILIILKWLRE